jgi:DNA-binding MarR family transcriptional regulator
MYLILIISYQVLNPFEPGGACRTWQLLVHGPYFRAFHSNQLQMFTKIFKATILTKLNKNCCTVGGLEISTVQSHIIYEIDQNDQPSMNQIADALGIDMSTFSRQIQTLIKMGLVKKTQHHEDKRAYILSLTTEGKLVATSISMEMNLYLEEVFSDLNEFERGIVIKSIKRLNESMAKSTVCCKPVF